MMIQLELTPDQFDRFYNLTIAGAKSPHTGKDAIMAGAEAIMLMDQALEQARAAQHDAAAPKANGHAAANESEAGGLIPCAPASSSITRPVNASS